MLFRPLTLNFSSTLILPWASRSFFNTVSLSHAEASGFPVHKKWQSASMVSPTKVRYILCPSVSVTPFKSTDCPSFTSTFLDFNHFRVLTEAFSPMNSSSLDPLCTSVTFLSEKSTAISPASSTPVGPPPTIRMEWADFIFWFSARENELHNSSADSDNSSHRRNLFY